MTRTVIGLIAAAGLMMADQVVLKNGDRITGSIVKSDEKTLVLKTAYAGEVTIERAQIESLKADEALHVQLKDKTVVGPVTPAPEGKVEVKVAQGAPVTAPLTEVLAFRAPAEQKAWEREQERLTHPRLSDFWSGFIGFSLAGASGNAQTKSIATTASATRLAGKNKMQLYFNQVYASQSNVEPFGATASRISGGYRIDRDMNKKLFVFGTTDFDYDKFQDLDLRSVLGGGLGYHVWSHADGYFNVNGGAVYNREEFATGLVRNSTEVLIGEEYGRKVFGKMKLYEKATFYPNMSETGEFRFTFDGGATIPVFKFLEWNIGISDRYMSNPIAGKKTNDFLYTTGIRLSFDQSKR
jgi:hypothetical protein